MNIKIAYIIFFILTLFIKNSCDIFYNKKNLTHGINTFPEGLDPGNNFSIDEIQIYSQIYETLVKLDEDSQTIIPWLAKDWIVSADYRLFTFHLQPNIRFHDNSILTAETVKFSFDRQLILNSSSPLLNMIDTVKVINTLTFSVTLKYSYALFLYNLTSPQAFVVMSKKALSDYYNLAYNPVGTGPYSLYKWKDDQEIILRSYNKYWKSKVSVSEVRFRYYKKQSFREKEIQEDNVDVLNTIIGFSIDRLKWLGTIDYKILNQKNVIYLGFNNKSHVLNNKFARKAITNSIDISKLVLNILRGNSTIAKGPLPPSFFNYKEIKQETYNIQKAKELLIKAGYSKGLKLKFYFPIYLFQRQTILELLKSNLSDVGITLDFRMFDSLEEYGRACKNDSSQLFLSGWGADVIGDPENFLYSLFHSKSEYNVLNYKNENVDSWLDQARREFDRDKRDILYQKIVEQIIEDTPAVFLYHVKEHFAYNTKKIKFLPVDPYGIIQYHQVELNEY